MVRWILVLALTGACAAAVSAAAAPSGLIVFSSSSGVDGKTQVWVMNANGTARRAVTPVTSAAEGPALSRDGRRIAFVRRDDVSVMSLNGTHVRRLTFSSAAESSPNWSSDGRWIAYSSYRSGRSAIW